MRSRPAIKLNETTTTALIFLGSFLVVGVIWMTIAVERGDIAWPPGRVETVEQIKPNPFQYVGVRPTFSSRTQTLLRDEEPEPAPRPFFRTPPLTPLGLALSLIGIGWMLVESFSQGSGWGYAVLFGNLIGGLFFVCAYPRRAWRPFSVQCVGYLAVLLASISSA